MRPAVATHNKPPSRHCLGGLLIMNTKINEQLLASAEKLAEIISRIIPQVVQREVEKSNLISPYY